MLGEGGISTTMPCAQESVRRRFGRRQRAGRKSNLRVRIFWFTSEAQTDVSELSGPMLHTRKVGTNQAPFTVANCARSCDAAKFFMSFGELWVGVGAVIPAELQSEVILDNIKFEEEITQW